MLAEPNMKLMITVDEQYNRIFKILFNPEKKVDLLHVVRG